ncbi:hypothetical protein DFQ26_005716 [Actinomortierella ambigua]|nr:hypothetical protein DFQ26_005716 [Actinomortierella ambigua]
MRGTGHVQRMISLDIRAAVQLTWACRDLEELDIPIVGACLTWPHDRCWDYVSNSLCRKMRRFSMGYDDRQGLVDNFPDETCHSSLNHDDCAPYTQSDDALPWTLGSGLEFLETSWKQLEYLGLAWTTHRAGMDELQWMLQHWPRLKQIDGFWRVCDYVDNIDHILFMDMHHPDVKLHNIVPRCGTKDP